MLLSFRERLTLFLIALLPFHALLVTLGTRLMLGDTTHPPLEMLAIWKEVVLVGVLLLAGIEWVEMLRKKTARLSVDVLDVLILLLVFLSILLFVFGRPVSFESFALGFRYDLLASLSFVLLRRVPWSEWFWDVLPRVILVSGVVVSVYALITAFLPQGFFTMLGYSDLHSLYVPGRPIAAFQNIEAMGLRRLQGPMSGPNQMGLWLLIPLSVWMMRVRVRVFRFSFFVFGLLLWVALIMSFSRAAWVGALVMGVVAEWQVIRRYSWRIGGGIVIVGLIGSVVFPSVLLRLSSSRGHLEKPFEAWHIMLREPFGLGLGTAGPASNRMSDSCVMLEPGSDPSWARPHADLCVFVGDTQVQPTDRACNCPLLTENWYLQIGVELGWLGFLLYLGLILGILSSLFTFPHSRWVFFSFLALSVSACFLHAWEDAAIAFTLWIALAALFLPGRGSCWREL